MFNMFYEQINIDGDIQAHTEKGRDTVKSFIRMTSKPYLVIHLQPKRHTIYRSFGLESEAFIKTDFRLLTSVCNSMSMHCSVGSPSF